MRNGKTQKQRNIDLLKLVAEKRFDAYEEKLYKRRKNMLKKGVISMMLIFSLFFVMFSNCNLHIANAGTKDTDTVQEGKDTTLSEELSMKFITSNYILASDGTVWSIEGEKY